MPYKVFKEGDKFCVYKLDDNGNKTDDNRGCSDTHEIALAHMRALYAHETKSLDEEISAAIAKSYGIELEWLTAEAAIHKREDTPKDNEGEYGDVEYADPVNKKYPLDTEKHIRAAWSYIGMPKNQKEYSSSEVTSIKNKIIAAWKRKINKEGPPAAKAEELAEAIMAIAAKSVYDASMSDYVWTGVSHNAWKDDEDDIIPLQLILDDIDYQKGKVEKGLWKQYGEGLWQDHQSRQVIGSCLIREVIEGGRSCFEGGELKSDFAGLNGVKMSIGYKYVKTGNEYAIVYVYERSALKSTVRINPRTFFSVKRRQLLSDAAMKAIADEISAFLEAQNG